MARASKDFLTQVREQAERTLAVLTAEIRKRELELEKLLEQARLWRDALTSSFTPSYLTREKRPSRKQSTRRKTKKKVPKAATGRKVARKRSSAAKKASAGKRAGRVDWDAILAAVPTTFTVDDVMKTPGAKSRGRDQVYPAINRWVKAKKVRKVGAGRYKRVA